MSHSWWTPQPLLITPGSRVTSHKWQIAIRHLWLVICHWPPAIRDLLSCESQVASSEWCTRHSWLMNQNIVSDWLAYLTGHEFRVWDVNRAPHSLSHESRLMSAYLHTLGTQILADALTTHSLDRFALHIHWTYSYSFYLKFYGVFLTLGCHLLVGPLKAFSWVHTVIQQPLDWLLSSQQNILFQTRFIWTILMSKCTLPWFQLHRPIKGLLSGA